MTRPADPTEKKRAQYAFNLTLAAVAGQVGCLTLVIIFLALFGGLWLDNRIDTGKPVFTIILMIGSIPVTLILMFWIVRMTTARISATAEKKFPHPKEDNDGGATS
jgi:FtsH-binding integral membrane protein